jgi:hypothetical protein
VSVEVYKTIPNPDRLAAWLESVVRPALSPDVSKYARGRLRVWLGDEPNLFAPFDTRPGLAVSERVLARLKELVEWDFDFCLATYSGDERAVGIAPHMDAGYADFEARSVHVSGECLFNYWENRATLGAGKVTGGFHLDRTTYEVLKDGKPAAPTHPLVLVPGNVTRFNCKDPHSASPGARRWNLNFWRKKPSAKKPVEAAMSDLAAQTRIDLGNLLGRKVTSKTEITCEHCPSNDDCAFSFDPYNTDGDCLAEK